MATGGQIIGTRPLSGKVYLLDIPTLAWTEFPYQPPGGRVGCGIWGGPDSTVWVHNNAVNPGDKRYLRFDGASSWDEFATPDSTQSYPDTICGSDDGQWVYAVGDYTSDFVHRFNGTVWQDLTGQVIKGRDVWCGSTGQYVWVTGENSPYFMASSDYGDTWSSFESAVKAGVDAWLATNIPGRTVSSIISNGLDGEGEYTAHVSVRGYLDDGNYGLFILRWTGAAWEVVSRRTHLDGAPTLSGYSGASLGMSSLVNVSASGFFFYALRDNSGLCEVAIDPVSQWGHHWTEPQGSNIAETDTHLALVMDAESPSSPARTVVSDDGLQTWDEVSHPWGSDNKGIQSASWYGWEIVVPPVFANQDPAPGSTRNPADTTIYAEVTDGNGDLDPSTVELYVNDTLAWTGGCAAPGFLVTLSEVADGRGYLITLPEPFEPGLQTVRGVASDILGNPMDETYSFLTTIGGHFVTGAVANEVGPYHYEEGVGWGLFPKAPPATNSNYANFHWCSHNDSLRRIWIGGRNASWTTNDRIHRLYEWDGENWTTHDYINPYNSFPGHLAISRAPGEDRIIFAAAIPGNGTYGVLLRFNDGVWQELRGYGVYGHKRYCPLAISATECVWICISAYDDGSGLKAGYWTDANTQYTGGDLPVKGFGGIAQLGDGTIFLLDEDGDIWRSDSHLGPFVHDNPTSGPSTDGFTSFMGEGSTTSMSASADGLTIVIQEHNGEKFWARNGYDDYTLCYTGHLKSTGQPAAIDRQRLLAGNYAVACRVSYDGGSTWSSDGGGPYISNGAVLDEVSSEQRLVALIWRDTTQYGWDRLVWRGDAPYSPWAAWRDVPWYSYPQAVQGFESGPLVITGWVDWTTNDTVIHYDRDTETSSGFVPQSRYGAAIPFGTEFAAGKTHILSYHGQVTELSYGRWNGADYDISAIPGSSRHSNDNLGQYKFGYHIVADDTGQDIWITVYESGQVWHSDDGGSTWTNRYSAAAAVHTDAGQARDVVVVSASEVYVAFNSTGTGTRFSRWTGSAWEVGAPNLTEETSDYRSIFADRSGAVWFFESRTDSNPTAAYKLVGGSWVLQHSIPVVNDYIEVTGIASLANDDALAFTARSASNRSHITQYTQNDPIGWSGRAAAVATWSFFIDVTPHGPEPPTQFPPVVQNQNPAPDSSGNDAATDVYLEITDVNGDLDISSVDIYINAVLALSGGAVQSGFSGIKSPVTNGYAYLISPWEIFDPGSQTVRVVASDLQSLTLDETYSFSTDAVTGICNRVQWGDFQWASEQWGACVDFSITATAINEYTIRVYFGVIVDESDATNPINYAITGGFRKLTVLQASMVNATTTDLTVLEMTDGAPYLLDVLFDPIGPTTLPFTGLGAPPRPVSVVNNEAGILEVYFSEQMLNDTSFSRPKSYIIEPHGNAAPLHVVDVIVDQNDLTKTVLAFVGGGSTYTLSVPGLMDPAGNYCDPPDILFEIENPALDELSTGDRIFVETDLGAIALTVSSLSKRRIEDLVIQRAKNLGHSAQISLISSALKDAGINRDEQKLKLFKG